MTMLANQAGVSLKPEHFADVKTASPADIWFEVHPENYFIDGGPRLRGLESIRKDYGLSLHGVGASLGGPTPPDVSHLRSIRRLVDRLAPLSVSEHAVWSRWDGVYYGDLLPLPRTSDALHQLVDGIDAYQSAIGRSILIENPTNYLPVISEMDEADFLVEAARKSGCGLLVDINNLYISSQNCGIDPDAYLQAIPPAMVGELHIAGYDEDPAYGQALLLDSHASPVRTPVWNLLDEALKVFGPKPVLLERDGNLPAYATLVEERNTAQAQIDAIAGHDSFQDKDESSSLHRVSA